MVIVKNLKNSHAYGIDRIDAASVKIAAKYLIGPITHIVKPVPGDRNFRTEMEIGAYSPASKIQGL